MSQTLILQTSTLSVAETV